MFFILNPNMKIIKGIQRDVCHSLLDGNTYYFDNEYKDIVRMLVDRESIQEIKKQFDNRLVDEVKTFLVDKHIGIFDEKNNVYIPTINKSFFKDTDERMKKFEIYSVMIRLNTQCNLNCKYCRIEKNELIAPCMCFKSPMDSINPYLEDIVNQSLKLGVQRVELIGGEPFLNKEELYTVLNKFLGKEVQFLIYTNCILVNEEDVVELAKYNVYIVATVHTFEENNEKYVGQDNEYTKLIKEKINLLIKYGLKFHIEFVVNKYNQKELKSTFLEKLMKQGCVQQKYLFPVSEYSVFDDNLIKTKVGNSVIELENYERAEHANFCFRKGPFIDVDGKIYPCIGLAKKEYCLGSIEDGLYMVYHAGKHKKYWNMSNEEDKECKYCAERLMCINCKAYKIRYGNKYNCINKK